MNCLDRPNSDYNLVDDIKYNEIVFINCHDLTAKDLAIFLGSPYIVLRFTNFSAISFSAIFPC